MDPNATLNNIRMVTQNYHVIEWNDSLEIAELLRELVEGVQSLDEWLSKGGFLPDAWRDR